MNRWKVNPLTHKRLHAGEHHEDAIDELLAELLGTASLNVNALLGADGLGGLEIKRRNTPIALTVFRTSGATFPNNANGFCHIGGGGAITGTEAFAQIQVSDCKVIAIRGRCTNGTATLTVRKNGVDTNVTGTVEAADDFFEITGEAEFADKDKLSLAYGTGVNFTVYGIQIIYSAVIR